MQTSQLAAVVTTALVISTVFLFPAPVDAQPQRELVEKLEAWLDRNSNLKRSPTAPTIVLADRSDADGERLISRMAVGTRTRGLYDKSGRKITLFRPWSATETEDVSVLLHELVHHRQAAAGHGCRASWEYQAYKLQQKWLSAKKVLLDVNWTVLGLATTCKLQNVHPD